MHEDSGHVYMCLTYFTCVIYAAPIVLGQNPCVSHMDCAVHISYGPPRYTKWAGCRCRVICWAFKRGNSEKSYRKLYCCYSGLWTKLCRDFKREYLDVALPCICVSLNVYFRYSINVTSLGVLFWQCAHFSDHNWLIGGQMSEVIWTERGGRACPVGPSVQTGFALGRKNIVLL